jgi:hypothetical protein
MDRDAVQLVRLIGEPAVAREQHFHLVPGLDERAQQGMHPRLSASAGTGNVKVGHHEHVHGAGPLTGLRPMTPRFAEYSVTGSVEGLSRTFLIAGSTDPVMP